MTARKLCSRPKQQQHSEETPATKVAAEQSGSSTFSGDARCLTTPTTEGIYGYLEASSVTV
ncbi:unnamed protein product [Cuscuta epithymum]|uniref:Uncharacterized protein n=1 Tax=Cuscuta epithymum TaxID=186058 RepID=A0AAV0G0X1_9ASTE|nr:unnamed protein product [Cuscuta epithymum]